MRRGGWRFFAAALAAGCSGAAAGGQHGDMALIFGGGGDGGGGDDGGTPPDLAQPPPGQQYNYAVNSITLPMSRVDFSIDLNGDDRVDNALGNIIGALTAQNFDVQTPVTNSILTGTTVVLMRLQSADPKLQTDPAASTTVYHGKQTFPNFNGNGTFTIDNSVQPSTFSGPLAAAMFSSDNPVTTLHPVELVLTMPLLGAVGAVTVHVNGAHLQFTTGTDAMSGAPGLLAGEIQGSIKNAEVQTVIIPAIAQLLTMQIQQNPTSQNAMMIRMLFDTGGCINANGMAAVANDGIIDPCEVANNNIIQNVLAPDVQIYDANGNYAPNPQNTKRDSLSLAIGFTGVQASF
jgi:hypothetical protein